MRIEGKVAVVTGGANGIGRALANEFAARGAAGVVVADLDLEYAELVAARIGAMAVRCDVGDFAQIETLVAAVTERYGRVDIFCSNAGYGDPLTWSLDETMVNFERITRVNMLSHLAAAKAVLPGMLERGSGYLLQTLSAAAFTATPAPPGYAMTKFGALGLAEWISAVYGTRGIRVSCLCPTAVYSGMFGRPKDLDASGDASGHPAAAQLGAMLTTEGVATCVADAVEGSEPFLILPNPAVGDVLAEKGADYDAWLATIRRRTDRMRQSGFGAR